MLPDGINKNIKRNANSITSFDEEISIANNNIIYVFWLTDVFQHHTQMIFYNTFIIGYVCYLHQGTLPVFMIADKKTQGIITAQIAFAVRLV